jgi:transcriptional regulator of acetoin/glycerol metabolism
VTTTRNPWLALPDGQPSPALTRRLRAAHEQLVTGGADLLAGPDPVRSVVRDSWRRCLGVGVDPDGSTPPVDLLDGDLLAYREAHPLARVMPVVRRLLVEDAEADRMIVAVTDAAGRMLWVEGDAALCGRAESMNFVEGSRWAEDVAGTNAPGTALALDHPVQIYGSEHFRRPVQPWSCSAAPVHDPVSGALLGAIDVTGGDHVASPHVFTLVRATVAAVEAELRWLHREQTSRAGEPGTAPPAPRPVPRLDVLGRDRARLVTPAGRTDLSLRHSELLLLLAEAAVTGAGRTAEELAAECHLGEAAPVTVRAELSRLRRLLGAQLVGSRPYRLLGRVDTDLDQVRRLLARGAVGSALERYPGAVLPRSVAPGVAVTRDRLSAQLRQAVLGSRRPELLLRYSTLPEAADDAVVWQALLQWLPAGSPRRAAAVAQLQRLRGPGNAPRPGRLAPATWRP